MDSDTEDSQPEGQVQEVSSSGGAVIEMQEFSDTDDNPYEVPKPSSHSVMSSFNSNAPVSFVSAPTNNETSTSCICCCFAIILSGGTTKSCWGK